MLKAGLATAKKAFSTIVNQRLQLKMSKILKPGKTRKIIDQNGFFNLEFLRNVIKSI